MKILDHLRNRSPREEAGDLGSAQAGPTDSDQLPIPGYNRFAPKEVSDRLHELSQIELATVETHERSHEDRPQVLNKLRYMRESEPLPGYDALSPEEIAGALAGADARRVKAVRDYERKFQHRRKVLAEAARVLTTAPANAMEDRAQEEKEARVREGFRLADARGTRLADASAKD
jgi:hypothetical protein